MRERIKKPRYGIDRPDLIVVCSVGGLLSTALGVSGFTLLLPIYPFAAYGVLSIGLLLGMIGLCLAAAFIFSSKVGKFRQRDRLLGSIEWRGDERVLDVGCGPGLLLIGATKRLTSGKAIGIDIWKRGVESRNLAKTTLENALLEGVSDRVEVKDGDVRNIPFEDAAFDVVMARAVLNHIRRKEERVKALTEMLRVLKPGGQLGVIVVDIWNLEDYLRVLRINGVTDFTILKRSGLLFLLSPVIFLTTIIARKPRKTQTGLDAPPNLPVN